MQVTPLILLALSTLSVAAPFAQVHHAGRDLAASYPSAPANVLKPISLHGRSSSKKPALVLLPSQGHTLNRRMLTAKIPKGKGRKKDDDDDDEDPAKPLDPVQAAREEKRRKKAADKEQAKKKNEEKKAELEAKKAELTPEQRAKEEADLKAQKEEDRKRNEENKRPAADFVIKDPQDYQNAWKEFSRDLTGKDNKGKDNKGWVEVDDIAKAFEKCVESGEFLFWTAAGNKAFEAAIPGYAESVNMMQIAKAAAEKKCQDAGLSGMGRPQLNNFVRKFIQDRIMDEEKKKNGKTGIPQPNAVQSQQIKDRISYDFFWPVMSAGYAKAASGKVVYVRPDNAVENPMSHWVRYEWPQLRKNSKVTEVHEVTFDVDMNVGKDALRTMQPKSDTVLTR